MYKQQNRTNKYNAKKCEYKGSLYDSRAEVDYAMELDMRVKAKDIKSWERQKKIELNICFEHISEEDGNYPLVTSVSALKLKEGGVEFIHIANYYIDFVVFHNDDSIEYVEVKGLETPLWKMKWKLCEAIFKDHPLVNLTIIKAYSSWRNYKPKK